MSSDVIPARDPDAIVETDWLEAHLGDVNLRIYDCTTYLHPVEPGSDLPYRVESGRSSARHLSRPPFSTAASKPMARSIHQTRVAHIMVPAL